MLKKLALLALSVALTLLAAEGLLRLLGFGAVGQGSPWFAGGNHPRFLFQQDAASGYTLRPGFSGREVSMAGEFDEPVAIDARGLRQQAHPAPARPVVLALGDSMTFGEGVAADATYAALLERELGVRVENGGVPGYGSPQMLGRLERLLPVLQPALVLMTLSPLWDRQRCARPFVYLEGYIVAHSYPPRLMLIDGNLYLKELRGTWGPWTARLQAHSALARLTFPLVGESLRGWRRARRTETVPTTADYEATATAVAAARDRATAAGAGFLAVLIDSTDAELTRDRVALEPLLAARGVQTVALDEVAPDVDWPRLRYPRDQHWTAAGHRAVATALAGPVRAALAASRATLR